METIWKTTGKPLFTNQEQTDEFHLVDTQIGGLFPYRIPTHIQWEDSGKTSIKTWLATQIGKDFKMVYDEFKKKIQLDHFEGSTKNIFWYVEKQEAILIDEHGLPRYKGGGWFVKGLYVHPQTNLLCTTNK